MGSAQDWSESLQEWVELVGIPSGVGGLARRPSEAGKIGHFSHRSVGIGQNFFRSGQDWTEFLWECLCGGNFVNRNSFRWGSDWPESLVELTGLKQVGLVRIPQGRLGLILWMINWIYHRIRDWPECLGEPVGLVSIPLEWMWLEKCLQGWVGLVSIPGSGGGGGSHSPAHSIKNVTYCPL